MPHLCFGVIRCQILASPVCCFPLSRWFITKKLLINVCFVLSFWGWEVIFVSTMCSHQLVKCFCLQDFYWFICLFVYWFIYSYYYLLKDVFQSSVSRLQLPFIEAIVKYQQGTFWQDSLKVMNKRLQVMLIHLCSKLSSVMFSKHYLYRVHGTLFIYTSFWNTWTDG